jgi:hypothetical protein
MPSPEIQAYLEARKARNAAEEVFLAELETSANVSAQADVLRAAKEAQFEALKGLLPSRLAARMSPPTDLHVVLLEDEFVWFPLLTEQFHGNEEAGEVAWSLGQRPLAT